MKKLKAIEMIFSIIGVIATLFLGSQVIKNLSNSDNKQEVHGNNNSSNQQTGNGNVNAKDIGAVNNYQADSMQIKNEENNNSIQAGGHIKAKNVVSGNGNTIK